MNKNGFMWLCEPNKNELLGWLHAQMKDYYGEANVVNEGTYLFARGNIPVMICAHLDTVHKHQCKDFKLEEDRISSAQGIGGDDRCGVYACLSLLKRLETDEKKPYMFFSTDEEVGGASTKRAATDLKDKIVGINFLIELDRANKEDSVYYKCGNKIFKKWIDSFGFKEANGTNTDICTLMKAWDLAGVNLSVGYYNNHRLDEYVVFSELEATIEKTYKIISAMDKQTLFPMLEEEKKTSSCGYQEDKYGLPGKFVKGDLLFVSRNGWAYPSPYYSSGSGTSVNIPYGTQITVKKTKGIWCSFVFNGQTLWIDEYYLAFNKFDQYA